MRELGQQLLLLLGRDRWGMAAGGDGQFVAARGREEHHVSAGADGRCSSYPQKWCVSRMVPAAVAWQYAAKDSGHASQVGEHGGCQTTAVLREPAEKPWYPLT